MRLRGEDSEGHLAVIEMSLTRNGHAPPLHVIPPTVRASSCCPKCCPFNSGTRSSRAGPERGRSHPGMCRTTWPILAIGRGRAGFERFFDRMIAKRSGEAFGEPQTEAERLTRAVGPPLSTLQ
jgi:hypothetical protein